MKLETLALHAGYAGDPTTHAATTPIYPLALHAPPPTPVMVMLTVSLAEPSAEVMVKLSLSSTPAASSLTVVLVLSSV